MSTWVRALHPYHFNGFVENILDGRWNDERIVEEFRKYLREECKFDNPSQVASIEAGQILGTIKKIKDGVVFI